MGVGPLSETIDWVHAAIASAAAVFGGLTGLIAGTWRMARIEPAIQLKLQRDLASLENDIRDEIIAVERRIIEKIGEAVHLFDETLKGFRQKINDVEMEMVRHYVAKLDFDDFRKEYREDMRDLKLSIGELRTKK